MLTDSFGNVIAACHCDSLFTHIPHHPQTQTAAALITRIGLDASHCATKLTDWFNRLVNIFSDPGHRQDPHMHGKDTPAEPILIAAASEFADKGFDGARVDAIARVAGVNKAMLYYRIGDKQALYDAVLERVLGQMADAIEQGLGQAGDSEVRIRRFIGVIAAHIVAMPDTARIMLREVASGGRHLPEQAVRQMGRIFGALDEAIRQGVEQGRFREVNSFMVHMMIIGSQLLYAANEPIRRRNAEQHPEIHNPEHFLSQGVAAEQISDMILAALRR